MKKTMMLILAICVLSCEKKKENTKEVEKIKIEDFDTFYAHFLQDSIFQRERTIMPLEGELKSMDDSVGVHIVTLKWGNEYPSYIDEKYMTYLKEEYPHIKFSTEKLDSLVIQKEWLDNSGFFRQRKYKLKMGKWFWFYWDILNV